MNVVDEDLLIHCRITGFSKGTSVGLAGTQGRLLLRFFELSPGRAHVADRWVALGVSRKCRGGGEVWLDRVFKEVA